MDGVAAARAHGAAPPSGRGKLVSETDPDAVQLTFPPGDGRDRRVILSMAGMHWYGRRTDPQTPAP